MKTTALDRPLIAESPSPEVLSRAELRILVEMVTGDKNVDISERLCISPETFQSHREHILAKLRLRGNAELVRYALYHQLVDIEGRTTPAFELALTRSTERISQQARRAAQVRHHKVKVLAVPNLQPITTRRSISASLRLRVAEQKESA